MTTRAGAKSPIRVNGSHARPDFSLERTLLMKGVELIAGVDEAGRGPLAGPVVAASVILPPGLSGREPWLRLVNDSKKLSPAQREQAAAAIMENALAVAVAQEDAGQVDGIGVGRAVLKAMLRAVSNLPFLPQHLLFDFVHLKDAPAPYDVVVKGDSLSYSIAAASILAKVTRDRLMEQADGWYPGYSFASNKGYPTAKHLDALRALGPSSIHRRSFRPVREAWLLR